MDSSEHLSQSEIDSLCNNVLPKVIDNGKLLSAVRAHLGATRSLKASIDASTSGLPPSDDDRTRLDLVLLLDSVANHSVEMIKFCLEPQLAATAGRPISSQKELAVNVFTIPFATEAVPAGSKEAWIQVRRRLFALEPTASILGLAKSGLLQLPAGLEDGALSLLEAATYKVNFNIAKESMRGLLDGNEIKVEVPGLSTEQWGSLKEFLFRLQRLQALVNELEDVGALMKCKYPSADEISRHGDGAIRSMIEQGIPKERALQIRNHAAVVAVRSEGMFTALLKARGAGGRKDDTLAVVTKAVASAAAVSSTEDPDKEADPPPLAPEINLSAMFDLESMGCEDCASVTGPAAYFVDLLQTVAAIELPDKTKLLQKLLKRRPDLGDLQLSCANTKILIPYIDLVNEALESVLWYLAGNGGSMIPAFDMDEYDTCESVIAQPRHVNYQVYSEILQKMVHPMNTFPYNQATDSTRAYLSALGSSRQELLKTLQSPYVITSDSKLFPGAQSVLDRSLAAETLNLQHEDYVAICQEGFYSLGFLKALGYDLDEKKYAALIDLRVTGQYWGYVDDASMVSDANGLTHIKDQLLPRSGISFKDFLSILQTNFINGRLVITSAKPVEGGPEFTGELADMRLRLLNSNGTVTRLNAEICRQLQSFLRLKSKLRWDVEELDAIAIPLAGSRTTSFDPQLLDGLAAVKQIADMSGHTPIELQPFWGDMSTHGPNSLYYRYFIRGPIPLAERKIFEPDENGQVLQGDEKMSEHIHTLTLALRESAASLNAIISTIGLSDRLSLPNVSCLYRVSLLSTMLGISPADYTTLLSLYPEGFDPFETPKATLGFLKEVQLLLSGDSEPWTFEQLMFVVKGKSGLADSKYDLDVGRVLKVATAIFSSLKASGINSGEEEQLSKGISASVQPKPKTRERQIITDSLKPQVQEVDDGPLMQFTLSEIIRVSDETLQRDELMSGMDILLALTDQTELPEGSFDGYFLPPKTDIYIISIETDPNKPPDDLVLNGEKISFVKGEDSGALVRWEATTTPLIEGRSYQLTFSGNVKDLRWTTNQMVGSPLAIFAQEILVPQEVVSNVTIVLSKLLQVLDVVNSFKLEISEVAFWQSNKVFDFNTLSFENVRVLKSYSTLKHTFSENKAAQPLLALYQWLHNPNSRSISLSELLAAVSARHKRTVQYFLQAKYPSFKEDDGNLRDFFKDVGALVQMQECFQLVDKLGLPSVSLGSFFGIAKPVLPPTVQKDFENAAALRLGLQSTFTGASTGDVKSVLAVANDQIRNNSRNALVQCLLLQDYAKENKLTDAEKLFAHFLIDVQMGPILQTSRIKQAIATVQLFVQRCMLGAEKENGITGSLLLDRTDWEYVMQYRLWEANRKAFLYPENWIDPTLRESKSEQFMAVEAAISQTNLDSDSIRNAIEGYVRSTNEVADLQIETYLWERQDKSNIQNYNSTFHIFGRTRTNPPTYYYRQVELSGSFITIIAYWSPWRKMNIDLPPHEGDSEGKKLPQPGSYIFPAKHGGRLFVFIPEIFLGEQPKDEDANKNLTFEQFSKQKISQTEADLQWEIQLGFTEYLNGVWSPKQVSTSTILILPDAKGKKLPDISSIKFWVHTKTIIVGDSKTEVISVRVELGKPATDGAQTAHHLGEFQLRGQHLLLIGRDNLPVSTYQVSSPSSGATMRTSFTKFEWPVEAKRPNEAAKSSIWNGTRLAKPLLGTLVQNADSKTLYRWAMSLDMINNPIPTGFIFDVSSVDSTGTYFAFPPQNPNPTHPVDTLYIYETFHNRVSPRLVDKINAGAGLQKLYTELSELPKELYWDAFGQRNSQIFHEKSTPFAIYNWELGVHVPSLLMERLMAAQQYDLALDVARLVFDPSAEGDTVDRCWSFPPFRDEQIRTGKGPAFDLEWKKKMTADEWRANKFSVHAAARGNPVSYMKRIATKYIEILIAAGDHYFRQDTLESVPLALQRYIEASQVFGPPPVEVPTLGKRAVRSYNQIAENLDLFSNAVVNMELEFPFYSEPGQRGISSMEGQKPLGFIKTEYFCIPGNPYLVNLRTLIDDRLYKIRNGMDIDGRQRTLALWEPPIDPDVVVRANARRAMAGLAVPASDPEAPMPKYRFQYLLGRAYELAHELKSTESKLLMMKEKKDAEALAALQREHRKAILEMALSVEQSRRSEWEKRIEIMEWERKGLEMRLRYFLDLTGDEKDIPQPNETWQDIPQVIEAPTKDEFRMSPYEKEEIDKLDASISLTASAQALRAIAQIFSAFPTASVEFEPLGVGGSLSYGGTIIAAPFILGADILEINARRDEGESRIASSRGHALGRLQGRRMDANMTGRSIVKLDKDIELLRRSLATQDLVIEQRKLEIEQAEAQEQWYQSRYSTQELYSLFENSLGILLYQTYVMGKEMATKVEEALEFESPTRYPRRRIPQSSVKFLDRAVQNGHMLGEALFVDLKQLEVMDIEDEPSNLVIRKTVSLRRLDPWALIQLRETGTANFKLSEAFFDMDFPGHYYRRIVSVGLSIPCEAAGPYTSLNCTLSLHSHKYRMTPVTRDADSYNDAADHGKDKKAFRTDRIPITSVAVGTSLSTSNAPQQQQSSSFELDFPMSGGGGGGGGGNSNRYGPFEGAGAISDWQIRLPSSIRAFDYDTISDVLLHIKYTSLDGGDKFRQTVENALFKRLANAQGTSSVVAIDIANEYAAQWSTCMSSDSGPATTLDLPGISNMLPYWTRRGKVKAESVALLAALPKTTETAPPLAGVELQTGRFTVEMAKSSALSVGELEALITQGAVGDVTGEWKIKGLGGRSTMSRAWLLIRFSVTGF